MDAVRGRVGSSQSWNRYAYVLGNPLVLTDPQGAEPEDPNKPKNPHPHPCEDWEACSTGPFDTEAFGSGADEGAPKIHVADPAEMEHGSVPEMSEEDLKKLWDAALHGDEGAAIILFGPKVPAELFALQAPTFDPIDFLALGVAGSLAKGTSTALARGGLTITEHTAERMAERGITERMIEVALSKGKLFWDPKHRTIVHVLERGFASGKSLLVAQDPVTGAVTTVIRGTKLVSPRFVPLLP